MKNKKISALKIILICVAILVGKNSVTFGADVSPENLYQEALLKETGERNLEEAVRIYQEVISKAGNNLLLSAKAQLQIGMCYEKLGKIDEAILAYNEVMKLTVNISAEVTQIAQVNLEKLKKQIEERSRVTQQKISYVPINVKPTHRREFNLEYVRIVVPENQVRYITPSGKNMVICSLDYYTTEHKSWGIEIGYLFPHETIESLSFPGYFISTTKDKIFSFYVGSYSQRRASKGRFGFFFRYGWGLWISHVNSKHIEERYENFIFVKREEQASRYYGFHPALITLTPGLDIKIKEHAKLTLGVQFMNILVLRPYTSLSWRF